MRKRRAHPTYVMPGGPAHRRRWRRVAIVAGTAVVSLATLVYVLLLYRPEIAPGPDRARVAPALQLLPRFQACWVEIGGNSFSTVSTLVVKHPQGTILIDAGTSSRFSEELEGYDLGNRLWLEALPGMLASDTPAAAILRRARIDPRRLRYVVLSHAHVDHAGGLVDLPGVPVLLAREELAFVDRLKSARSFHVIPAHARALLGRATAVAFDDGPYETFAESHDLFGDGSVVLVPLRGHTPGSIGTFVNLRSDRRLFHVGDAVNDRESVERRIRRPLIMRPTDVDPHAADAIVAHLERQQIAAPDVELLPAHDRAAWEDVFGGEPPRCIGE